MAYCGLPLHEEMYRNTSSDHSMVKYKKSEKSDQEATHTKSGKNVKKMEIGN